MQIFADPQKMELLEIAYSYKNIHQFERWFFFLFVGLLLPDTSIFRYSTQVSIIIWVGEIWLWTGGGGRTVPVKNHFDT